MNFFCGTDIIEISRIKKAIETKEKRFLNKIYTDKEIEYCENKKEQKYEHYAARFAAKEAVYKAISSIIKDSIEWKKIEVINTPGGRPTINTNRLNIKSLQNIEISLSHCKEYAIATAVTVFKEN